MSDDFHEIREKTGIDKIKGSERKDLFKKFQDGGGELLDDGQNKTDKQDRHQVIGSV